MGLAKHTALGGILCLLTTPILFQHATIGYSNLPMAVLVVLGTLWGAEGIQRRDVPAQLLSGLFFCLVAWTRPDGFLYSAAGICSLMILWVVLRRGPVRWMLLFLPVVTLAGVWFVFYSQHGGGESLAANWLKAGLIAIFAGQPLDPGLKIILQHGVEMLIDWQTWGLLHVIGILFLIHRPRWIFQRKLQVFWASLVAAIGYVLITFISFYPGHFDKGLGFLVGWLERGLARAMLPPAIMLFVSFMMTLGDGGRIEVENGDRLRGRMTGKPLTLSMRDEEESGQTLRTVSSQLDSAQCVG